MRFASASPDRIKEGCSLSKWFKWKIAHLSRKQPAAFPGSSSTKCGASENRYSESDATFDKTRTNVSSSARQTRLNDEKVLHSKGSEGPRPTDSASSEFPSSRAAKKTARCTYGEGKQRNEWEDEGKMPRRVSPVYNSLFLPPMRKIFFFLWKKASSDETS